MIDTKHQLYHLTALELIYIAFTAVCAGRRSGWRILNMMENKIYVIKSVVLDGSGVDEPVLASFSYEKILGEVRRMNIEELTESGMVEKYGQDYESLEEMADNIRDFELDVSYFIEEVDVI